MKKFIKKHGFSICMLIICMVGIVLVAYPSVSDYWNSKVQSKAIQNYQQKVNELSDAKQERIKLAAKLYNQGLYNSQRKGTPLEEGVSDYEDVLNVNGDGIMGYIVIPAIDVELPIYHGTDEKILQVAVGHSEISSIPVGGENTHSVLLGHRGLPSAKLFNDLDQLVEDDYFEIHVLNEILYYRVYDIQIVEPKELNNLRITGGKDIVTLVTCTPYGVNTHRLLIFGERTDEIEEQMLLIPDARRINKTYVAIGIGIVLWILSMMVLIYVSSKHKNRRISRKEQQRRRKIIDKYQK